MRGCAEEFAMTADTIYYLGSTVAQTLGSLAGFLGAFVLFYLQTTERSLSDFGARIGDSWDLPDARGAAEASEFDRFEERMRAHAATFAASGGNRHFDEHFREFLARRGTRRAAVGQFKGAVIVTAPVLLLSLVLIEFAPAIIRCAALAWILSGALIVGAAYCGWLYWTVIRTCIGRG
jgi:hypothetical protein